jgi:hypothetical protein
MNARKVSDADNNVRVTVTLPKETYRHMRFIAADRDTTAANIMAHVLIDWTGVEFKKLRLTEK